MRVPFAMALPSACKRPCITIGRRDDGVAVRAPKLGGLAETRRDAGAVGADLGGYRVSGDHARWRRRRATQFDTPSPVSSRAALDGSGRCEGIAAAMKWPEAEVYSTSSGRFQLKAMVLE